jgi:hypothetical protein
MLISKRSLLAIISSFLIAGVSFAHAGTVYEREIVIDLDHHLRIEGSVRADDPRNRCQQQPVLIQRKSLDGGMWKRVKEVEPRSEGFFQAEIPDRPGRYRVIARAVDVNVSTTCAFGKSAVLTHRHG